jgi:hypothetical protein
MKGNALQRRTKNSGAVCAALCLAFGLVFAAGDAFAQVIGSNGEICPAYSGFLSRIVPCIIDVIVATTTNYLSTYIVYFTGTMSALMTLAVLIYAITMLTGRTNSVTREGVILVLKLGGVMFTMNVLAVLFPTFMDMMSFLVYSVSFYLPAVLQNQCPFANNLWESVDCGLAYLVGGILPGFGVENGLFGFLVASLFSGPIGVATFFFGLGVMLVLVYTLFQAVYILLGAYVSLALLMAISPLMVPLLVLKVTKGYFEKWLRLLMSVILQPMFLFAYLTMMLLTMESVIFTGPFALYRTIACGAVDGNWSQSGFNIGNYIAYSGGAAERDSYAFTVNQTPEILPEPRVSSNTGIPGQAALDESGTDIRVFGTMFGRLMGNIGVEMPTVALNYNVLAGACGMSSFAYVLNVLLSFVMAAAMAYVMYALIGVIPYLGAGMTGELFGIQSLERSLEKVLLGKFMPQIGKGGGG